MTSMSSAANVDTVASYHASVAIIVAQTMLCCVVASTFRLGSS